MILETCNRVVLLDKGKVVSIGDTKQILSNSELMEQHGLEIPMSIRSFKYQ